jgi:hypothetical protein
MKTVGSFHFKMNIPSLLFKTTKPNKQSVVEPVGLRLLHVTDLFLYFSLFFRVNSIENPTAIPFPNGFLSFFQKRPVSLKIQRTVDFHLSDKHVCFDTT